MKAVIDDKIPYIREVAGQLFDECVYLPGREISAANVHDADVLIVRTRTRCDRTLLEGSRVRFIATATIGYDHLDAAWLREAGIAWANCPGCNASSVGQYVRNSLFVLRREGIINPYEATVGIVGAGHVGTAVQKALQPLGCRILLNDPPREEAREGTFYSLSYLAAHCDVLTFHTPLTHEGKYPTFHLANEAFFRSIEHHPVLINAARGGVVDEANLLQALDEGLVRAAVTDTWENEPDISRRLLERSVIATPHIAGYSADGKCHATQMALEAVCRFFGWKTNFVIKPPLLPADLIPSDDEEERALQLYDPRQDSKALKEHPEQFEWLRGHYPLRREVWK